jgi:hypothetical protein
MAERARDGDSLWMRGTCPGRVRVVADLVLRGVGDGPAITGRLSTPGVRIRRSATVTLQDLVIRRGRTGESALGGAILNSGDLALINVTLRDGRAGYGGGGIANYGTLTMVGSTVADNRSGSYGGGIFNVGTLTVIDSRVSSNRADEGGGIANVRDSARITLDGSTITGNVAGFVGGGILNADIYEPEPYVGGGCGGTVTLIASNVTGNEVESGGGIVNHGGGAAINLDAASSVTGNIPDDCVGTVAC